MLPVQKTTRSGIVAVLIVAISGSSLAGPCWVPCCRTGVGSAIMPGSVPAEKLARSECCRAGDASHSQVCFAACCDGTPDGRASAVTCRCGEPTSPPVIPVETVRVCVAPSEPISFHSNPVAPRVSIPGSRRPAGLLSALSDAHAPQTVLCVWLI